MRLFDMARGVPAVEVARRASIPLKRQGAREWACCPLHGEKTASLCFYPDGGWYCFGCHAGGNAVDLYAALYNVGPVEAACLLVGEQPYAKRTPVASAKPKPQRFGGTDEGGSTWGELCDQLHQARTAAAAESADTPRLWAAVAVMADAETRLDNWIAREEL